MSREHYKLLEKIAERLARKYYVDPGDLIGYGWIGYKEAMQQHDPKKSKLTTRIGYLAMKRMIDYIRDIETPVKRSQKLKYNKILKIEADLEDKLKSRPTVKEIVEAAGISYEKYMYHFRQNNVISLDSKIKDTYDNRKNEIADIVAAPEEPERYFEELIRSLNKREKDIFRLYYIDQMTMKEIANLLKLSESRVSQVMSDCNVILREELVA